MKKLLLFLVLAAFSAMGCGKDKEPPEAPKDKIADKPSLKDLPAPPKMPPPPPPPPPKDS